MTVAQAEATGYYTARSAETGKEIKLAMQRLWLTGQVTPFGARLLVEHTFRSGEPKPIEAIYAFMLPQDATLRSFRVTGDGFEIKSDLQPVEEAVATYEAGIDAGSLSVLARQYTDGMMNLTVGNLQPDETVRVILEIIAGVERHDDGFRFRFPFTLAPSYHSSMKTVTLPEGGEMELPREEFGDLILPTWKHDASNLHGVGFDLEVLGGQKVNQVRSPSHGVTVEGEGDARRIGLAVASDLPDRDLVLEARVDEPWGLAWSAAGTFSALLGSTRFGEPDEESPRQVVFVLDRSGSMSGRPIEQAKKAIEAGIAAMRPGDQFSIVAFDHDTEVLSRKLLEATDKNRGRARQFLSTIDARGGTELAKGVRKAAKLTRNEGGDLLLLTDGQVFGAPGALSAARKAGARIHALGIGSASQDRLLSQLGRKTGGQSRFMTPRERVDLALLDLFAAISPPVACDVRVQAGDAVLAKVDVSAGMPVLVRKEGGGPELAVEWGDGSFTVPVVEPPAALGEALRLLYGAARITDAESAIVGEPEEEDADILEALSRQYGLASRAMALVAVVKRDSDQPGELPQTQVVPVGMPQDVVWEAYFGLSGRIGSADQIMQLTSSMGLAAPEEEAMDSASATECRPSPPFLRGILARKQRTPYLAGRPGVGDDDDLLLELASLLEADGGMPGETPEERIEASLDLLVRLIDHGSTRAKGPFRHHVRRLLEFLEDSELSEEQEERLAKIGELVEA